MKQTNNKGKKRQRENKKRKKKDEKGTEKRTRKGSAVMEKWKMHEKQREN